MVDAKKQSNNAVPRPPIVAVMGHIDHGKSTLLDYIRKENVVETESGGITQHISAYEVVHEKDGEKKKITFLDTPGHEAFASMRTHGTHVADIAILVVAADDHIQTQALEAYAQIKNAGIPLIVAVNKIDKEGANPERIKNELTENQIYLEGYGGDIPYVEISAKSGQGVSGLLDALLLVSEMEELTGDPAKNASGFVLESNLDPRRGISATLMITDGTLEKGDCVRAGTALSPVRTMENFRGKQIEKAQFSSPVRIAGFDKEPQPGDSFEAYASKKEATDAEYVENVCAPSTQKIIGNKDASVVIPVIVRADTQGTLNAVLHEIEKVPTKHVAVKVVQCGAGDITENDIKLAVGAENPIVTGFRVRADNEAANLADRHNIPIHTFAVIYSATDFLEEEIKKRTPAQKVEKETGRVKILRVFSATKKAQVVGGKVQEGYIEKSARVKVERRGTEIGHGVLQELQQQKASVDKVNEGSECGMMIEANIQIAEGDVVAPFVTTHEK